MEKTDTNALKLEALVTKIRRKHQGSAHYDKQGRYVMLISQVEAAILEALASRPEQQNADIKPSARRLAEEFVDGFTPPRRGSFTDIIEDVFLWLQDRSIPEQQNTCPTCDATDPDANRFCSDGFHAKEPTYWPEQQNTDINPEGKP